MKREKFAMFLIVNDETDTHEMHLLHDGDANKLEIWRQLIAAVFAQGVEEYPDLFDEVFEMEV